MARVHQITTGEIGWEKIQEIIREDHELKLSDEVKQLIAKCRNYLDQRLSNKDEVLYGINTGFGSLCDTVISDQNLGLLQNTLRNRQQAGPRR